MKLTQKVEPRPCHNTAVFCSVVQYSRCLLGLMLGLSFLLVHKNLNLATKQLSFCCKIHAFFLKNLQLFGVLDSWFVRRLRFRGPLLGSRCFGGIFD